MAFVTAVEESPLQQTSRQARMTGAEGSDDVVLALGPASERSIQRALEVAKLQIASLREDLPEERVFGIQKGA